MFIPPNDIKKKFDTPTSDTRSKVKLKSSHLYIEGGLVKKVFGEDQNVFVVYYADRNKLMLAPISDDSFKKLHKAGQHILKDRNVKGDKVIALHEILIDNTIATEERDLSYEYQNGMGVLIVEL